jgi:hypothetical protein
LYKSLHYKATWENCEMASYLLDSLGLL